MTPPDEPKKEQKMPGEVSQRLDQIEDLEKALAEQKQTSLETQKQFLALQEKIEMLELVNRELEVSLENKTTETPQEIPLKKVWWQFWK